MVLRYNRWTGYENCDIARYFAQATPEQILELRPGDAIWLDDDPIHPLGKVYGFVKCRVAGRDAKGLYFEGGFVALGERVYLANEAELARQIAIDPRLTQVM